MADRPIVLLVDDNDDVRNAISEILEENFSLLVAARADKAVQILRERPVDLLLTDIVMPGMDGFELADIAVSMRPSLRVVYMSGYSDQANAERPRPRHGRLISKPFRPAQLVSEIKSALRA